MGEAHLLSTFFQYSFFQINLADFTFIREKMAPISVELMISGNLDRFAERILARRAMRGALPLELPALAGIRAV